MNRRASSCFRVRPAVSITRPDNLKTPFTSRKGTGNHRGYLLRLTTSRSEIDSLYRCTGRRKAAPQIAWRMVAGRITEDYLARLTISSEDIEHIEEIVVAEYAVHSGERLPFLYHLATVFGDQESKVCRPSSATSFALSVPHRESRADAGDSQGWPIFRHNTSKSGSCNAANPTGGDDHRAEARELRRHDREAENLIVPVVPLFVPLLRLESPGQNRRHKSHFGPINTRLELMFDGTRRNPEKPAKMEF